MGRFGWLLGIPAIAGCSGGESTPDSCTALAVEGITACPSATTVKGVDVSHYDGAIDWPTVHAAAISFAFVKATESTDYTDPQFAGNWAAMKSAGVVRGAYHFFHPDVDPSAQMTFFLHTIESAGGLVAGDLPPAIDFEVTNGVADATIAANLKTAILALQTATGMTPIVYTSPSFANGILPAGFGSTSTLWVANWQVSCPSLPAAWTGWKFWQSSDSGKVPGISSAAVDLDEFDGTLDELQMLGGPPLGAGGAADAGAPGRDSGAGSQGGADGGSIEGGSVAEAGAADAARSTSTDSGAGSAGHAAPCAPR
jgi:lysozyme